MATKFKMLRTVNRSYEEQGYIYFCCKTYRKRPKEVQKRIRDLCKSAAGEHWRALLCFVSTDKDWRSVCTEYYISTSTLDRCRTKLYRIWDIWE